MGLVLLAMLVIEGLESPRPVTEAAPITGDVLELRLGAPPGEAAAEPGEVAWHVVQPGETLSDIALRYFGDVRRAAELARLNGLADPDRLRPGQTLRLR